MDLSRVRPVAVSGRVVAVTGSIVRASLPLARVGDVVGIEREAGLLPAEVVGFDDRAAVLAPLGDVTGVRFDDVVRPLEGATGVRVSDACLGRVLGPLGDPLDGGGALDGGSFAPFRRAPPTLAERRPVDRQLVTGLRVLDGLSPLGEGQRVGLFAASGAGKSTLLERLARSADVDVVVIGLVGERGREAAELSARLTASGAASKTVVVVATSDAPPLLRVRAAECATAVAEGFRDTGKRVLLAIDSITRVARALREVGLSAGEPPARRGFPPSTFSYLPRLCERAGMTKRGSITGIYTVLVEGDDPDEPVADEVRGLLDGHVVLSRDRLARGALPPIDPVLTLSRVADALTPREWSSRARKVRAWIAAVEQKRDLLALGGHVKGADPLLDEALEKSAAVDAFLHQPEDRGSTRDETRARLAALTG